VKIGDKVEQAESATAFRFFKKILKSLSLTLKIWVYFVGKARDTHANAMAEE